MELASVTETGEDIVSNVKKIVAEVQGMHRAQEEPCIIHFVSDSGGPYKKARRLLKDEGVRYVVDCMFRVY